MSRPIAIMMTPIALFALCACATPQKQALDTGLPSSMETADPCTPGKAAANGARLGLDVGIATTKKPFQQCARGDFLACAIAPAAPIFALPTGLFLAPILAGAELASPVNERATVCNYNGLG